MSPSRTRKTAIALFLLASALAFSQSALAQDPDVYSADPPSAEQGAINFEVTISGNGFDKTAKVYFLKSGTEDPAGITVNRTRFVGADTLIANIDVSDTAEIAEYDIEVRMSRGRRGKGTDLFKVEEKTTGSGHSELSASFCLRLEDLAPGLAPDILPDPEAKPPVTGEYCDDKREKVKIGTGSGPGFRFDTNTSKNAPQRTVEINLPDGWVDIYDDFGDYRGTMASAHYNIDLRFNKTDQDGGLDLGAMTPGVPDYVPIDISINDLDGIDQFLLGYGETSTPASHGYLGNNPCIANYGLDAQVTRLTEGSWHIQSNPADSRACLWIIDESLEYQEGTVVELPFDFVIWIK